MIVGVVIAVGEIEMLLLLLLLLMIMTLKNDDGGPASTEDYTTSCSYTFWFQGHKILRRMRV